jgi:transcriptional regulator with GAF, ATPase, and Fis domain
MAAGDRTQIVAALAQMAAALAAQPALLRLKPTTLEPRIKKLGLSRPR